VEASPATFEGGGGGSRKERAQEALMEQLYQQIVHLKVDWLRKKGNSRWP
jgi:hypothetical protein